MARGHTKWGWSVGAPERKRWRCTDVIPRGQTGLTESGASKPRNPRGIQSVGQGNQPISHHYVPRWLLKRFCDEKGRLWWRRRSWPPEKVHPQLPTSVFYENHLNTLYATDGSKDPQVEEALANVDGELCAITDKLVKQGQQGNPPDLDEESRARLYSYIFVQYKRSPDLHGDGKWPHNARVTALLQPNEEVGQVLSTKGLSLMCAPPGSALVVGSQVVLRASAGQAGRLEDEDQGLAFPLASDVMLGLVHGSSRREHDVLSAEQVVSVNRATAAYCQEIAGPDLLTVRRAVN